MPNKRMLSPLLWMGPSFAALTAAPNASVKAPMKIVSLIILSILWSVHIAAFECRKTNNSYDVKLHWGLASEVVAGKIVSGEYLNSEDPYQQIKVKLKIQRSFKGAKNGVIEIFVDPYPELAIGKDYIVFLYGSNQIDFCSKYIALLAPAYDSEFLVHTSKRTDIDYAKDLQFILRKSGIVP